jgi:hypothetical protein
VNKRKLTMLIIVILIISLFLPISFMMLFVTDKGDSTYHLTFKEFNDKYEDGELKPIFGSIIAPSIPT